VDPTKRRFLVRCADDDCPEPDFVREPDRLFKFTWRRPPNWLILHPVGDGIHVSADAIGSRFAARVTEPDGSSATVHGTLFGGSCFSASNGPDVYLGLAHAKSIQLSAYRVYPIGKGWDLYCG